MDNNDDSNGANNDSKSPRKATARTSRTTTDAKQRLSPAAMTAAAGVVQADNAVLIRILILVGAGGPSESLVTITSG